VRKAVNKGEMAEEHWDRVDWALGNCQHFSNISPGRSKVCKEKEIKESRMQEIKLHFWLSFVWNSLYGH